MNNFEVNCHLCDKKVIRKPAEDGTWPMFNLDKLYLLILPVLIFLITISSLVSVEAQNDNTIPSWIKQNALWWGEGKIDDSEFVKAMEYLVSKNILKITESKDERYIEKYKAWAKKEIQKYKDYSEKLQLEKETLEKYKQTALDKIHKLSNEIRNQQSKYADEYKYST